MNKDDLRVRAQELATASLRRTAPTAPRRETHPAHLVNWWDNLIDGVTRDDCESDLDRGAGSETRDRQHKSGAVSPAKFCAPYSSSALAVNTFGPFRHAPEFLRLDGRLGVTKVEFEYPCANGLRTRHRPHFDLYAESPAGVIAVESKFLELLGSHDVDFKAQYDRPFGGADGHAIVAEDPWRLVYQELKSGALIYQHLDAAQLVKHYLGLVHCFRDTPRTLLYLFWEPDNWDQVNEFSVHRTEVQQFADLVNRCSTRFEFLSYRELWRDWELHSTWPGMPAHLGRLRQRYAFPIS